MMAERAGFEPAVPRWGHTRFPGEHLQPLGHLSKKLIFTENCTFFINAITYK